MFTLVVVTLVVAVHAANVVIFLLIPRHDVIFLLRFLRFLLFFLRFLTLIPRADCVAVHVGSVPRESGATVRCLFCVRNMNTAHRRFLVGSFRGFAVVTLRRPHCFFIRRLRRNVVVVRTRGGRLQLGSFALHLSPFLVPP